MDSTRSRALCAHLDDGLAARLERRVDGGKVGGQVLMADGLNHLNRHHLVVAAQAGAVPGGRQRRAAAAEAAGAMGAAAVSVRMRAALRRAAVPGAPQIARALDAPQHAARSTQHAARPPPRMTRTAARARAARAPVVAEEQRDLVLQARRLDARRRLGQLLLAQREPRHPGRRGAARRVRDARFEQRVTRVTRERQAAAATAGAGAGQQQRGRCPRTCSQWWMLRAWQSCPSRSQSPAHARPP